MRLPAILALLAATALSAAEPVLVVRPPDPPFQQADEGFRGELGQEARIRTVVLTGDEDRQRIDAAIAEVHPRVVLALDNAGVALTEHVQVPRIVTMAIQVDAARLPPGTCGIAYDVPGFALLTRFRSVTGFSPGGVLVVHRPSVHARLIDHAQRQLAEEGIRLIPLDATAGGDQPRDVAEFLRRRLAGAVADPAVQAVWILNDPWQLDPDLVRHLWLPLARRTAKPFLAGIPTFVDPRLGLAVFAAAPDPATLGLQAGQQARDLLGGLSPAAFGVEPMLGILAVIDGDRADALGLPIREPLRILRE
jgi:hypothetical protein